MVDAYVEKLNPWGKVQPGDVEGLDRLTLFLIEIKHVMVDLDIAGELEHPRTLRGMTEKLPSYIRDRWLRVADDIMEEGHRVARLRDLVDFLARGKGQEKSHIWKVI